MGRSSIGSTIRNAGRLQLTWEELLSENPALDDRRFTAISISVSELLDVDLDAGMTRLAQSTILDRFDSICVHGHCTLGSHSDFYSSTRGAGDAFLGALAQRSLPNLEELSLPRGHVGTSGVADLVRASWPRLRVLDLSGNDLMPAEAKRLATWPGLARIEKLQVGLSAGGLTELLSRGWPEALRDLDLTLHEQRWHHTTNDLRVLLDCPGLERAQRVRLHVDSVGIPGAELIADSPHASAFELSCEDGQRVPPGALPLVRLSGVAASDRIDLSGYRLQASYIADLAHASRLREVRALSLANTGLAFAGLAALVDAGVVARLASLDLSQNRDLTGVVRLIAGAPERWPMLRELNLRNTATGDEGARMLAGSPVLGQLETLDLSHTKMTDAGGIALAGSPHCVALRVLFLQSNEVTDATVQAIVASRHLTKLEDLRIGGSGSDSDISDAGGLALARSTNMPALRIVSLGGRAIGAATRELLARRFTVS